MIATGGSLPFLSRGENLLQGGSQQTASSSGATCVCSKVMLSLGSQ